MFLETLNGPLPICQECVFLLRGVCNSDNISCTCFTSYSDYLCRTITLTTESPLSSSATTNWTVIVAVISAIAGLLLIIAAAILVFYIVKRCRRSQPE
jgi:hypothetical protein